MRGSCIEQFPADSTVVDVARPSNVYVITVNICTALLARVDVVCIKDILFYIFLFNLAVTLLQIV